MIIAQARIGSKAQDILDEFQGEDIEFLYGEKGNAYILFKIDEFIEVYYYLREHINANCYKFPRVKR